MDSHGIQRRSAQQEQSDSSAEKNVAVVDNTTLTRTRSVQQRFRTAVEKAKSAFWTFGRFVGPGFMISVAYSKSLSRLITLYLDLDSQQPTM